MVGQLLITVGLYYFGFLSKEDVKVAIELYIKPYISQEDKINELLEKIGVIAEEGIEKEQKENLTSINMKDEIGKTIEKALMKGLNEWNKKTAEEKNTLYRMALKYPNTQYSRKIIHLYESEKDIILEPGEVNETTAEKQEKENYKEF